VKWFWFLNCVVIFVFIGLWNIHEYDQYIYQHGSSSSFDDAAELLVEILFFILVGIAFIIVRRKK